MSKTYICDAEAGLTTIRDPMIMVAGDTYYLTGTQPPYWTGENAGVHLWSSKDLKHFTDHGLIIKREEMPEAMWCRDRFWAPELFTDGKKFYATFNCKNESNDHAHDFGVGLAVADRPEGPYTILSADGPVCDGIDGNIFLDDDGQLYLASNGVFPESGKTGLFLRKLDGRNGIATDTQLVCKTGAPGEWDHEGVEGQCLIKRHGIYFQWYSAWGEWQDNGYYRAGFMTAPSIHGPWTKNPTPIIKPNEEYTGCGHNHSFRGLDGKDYVVFHAICRHDDPDDRRERMYLREVEYRPDGTVVLI